MIPKKKQQEMKEQQHNLHYTSYVFKQKLNLELRHWLVYIEFFLALEELFILEPIDVDGASLYNLKLAIYGSRTLYMNKRGRRRGCLGFPRA